MYHQKNVQRHSQEIDDTECMALGELATTFSLAGLYPIHKLMILVGGGGRGERIVTKYVYTSGWTNLLAAHIKKSKLDFCFWVWDDFATAR
jgi:hypothetical protein